MKTATAKQRGIYEKLPGSGIWWIRYVDARGILRREKGGSRSDAIKLRTIRKADALRGKKLPSDLRSVTRVEDIAPALARDYQEKDRGRRKRDH